MSNADLHSIEIELHCGAWAALKRLTHGRTYDSVIGDLLIAAYEAKYPEGVDQ